MPVLILLLGALIVILVAIALMPLSLVLRYRAGTMRRTARGWIAAVNAAGFAISVGIFLAGAAVASYWMPGAFRYAAIGLGIGCVLGLLGLALTRWEHTTRALYYTPNRLLVLAVTLVVALRILYGFARSWQAWRAGNDDLAWIATSGVAGSLAAGAVVLGYYLTYWLGVRRQVKRHERRPLRPM